MTDTPTRPSDAVVKRLFALSANRCAFPRCTVDIVQGETVVGEICHIQAVRPDGPRHDRNQSPSDRHGYDNLLLLCANHHKVIDDDPAAYTVERLRKMKADHEDRNPDLPASEIEHAARLLIDQTVIALNQSGGITAHTVHQTFNLHPPVFPPNEASQRRSAIAHLRKFHQERVDKVVADKAPFTLLRDGTLVVHLLPLHAAVDSTAPVFDLITRHPERFPPINGAVQGARIDYEGLATASNARGIEEPQRAYVMVFRFGGLEAVASSLAGGPDDDYLVLPDIEAMIVEHVCLYAQQLSECGIEAPFAVFASLVEIDGRKILHVPLAPGAFAEDLSSAELTHERLQFQECVFESAPTDERECAKQLRPMLDHLANAAGLMQPTCFDSSGNYDPTRDR